MSTIQVASDVVKMINANGRILATRIADLMNPASRTAQMLKTSVWLTVEDAETLNAKADKVAFMIAQLRTELNGIDDFLTVKYTEYSNK